MPIPYPSYQKVVDEARNGVPAARLIVAAIVMMSYATGEQNVDIIYQALIKKAKGEI